MKNMLGLKDKLFWRQKHCYLQHYLLGFFKSSKKEAKMNILVVDVLSYA